MIVYDDRMLPDSSDTIIARASAPGPSTRAIVRISGPRVFEVLERLFRPAGEVSLRELAKSARSVRVPGHIDVASIDALISGAAYIWPTARSYTGQPMAELHLPGSAPVVDAIMDAMLRSRKSAESNQVDPNERAVRTARPGEFTLRAFLAGRIDLVQAEAVLGVIDAADHEELETALRQLGGAVTNRLAETRTHLLTLLADLEAGLDFVEEDIHFITPAQILARLSETRGILADLAADATSRLTTNDQRRVLLAGLPNAGKSTLLNRLCDRDAAIVSELPGTTRDVVTAEISLNDIPVLLIDTAGWDETGDDIMQVAMRLRSVHIEESDLVVWCSAADQSPTEHAIDDRLLQSCRIPAERLLRIRSRCDVVDDPSARPMLARLAQEQSPAEDRSPLRQPALVVSGLTGEGIGELRETIHERLLELAGARGELLGTTAVRCRDSVTKAIAAIDAACVGVRNEVGDELISLDIREALREIGVILGDVDPEEVLDHVFSRFCIGK